MVLTHRIHELTSSKEKLKGMEINGSNMSFMELKIM
jgi:hypothetical protein